MGLNLSSVSKNYGYDEEQDDYVGEKYGSTDIGYGGWKFFRDGLLKFCSNGKYSSIDDNLDGSKVDALTAFYGNNKNGLTYCYYDDKNYRVAMDEDLKNEKLNDDMIAYLKKLDYLKNNYSKVYAIYPLIAHSDCEGEMPYTQLEPILPILKEYNIYCKENNIKYGYSGWDYDFLGDFIKIVQEVIENKGKLLFG